MCLFAHYKKQTCFNRAPRCLHSRRPQKKNGPAAGQAWTAFRRGRDKCGRDERGRDERGHREM